MAPAAASGRQRYQWLLLLVAAVLLVAWLFVDGGQGDDATGTDPAGGRTTSSASPSPATSPSHDLTATTTPTTDPTSDPSGTGGVDPDSGLALVEEASLPAEARDVLDRIDAGGPFKYPDDDGGTFQNREDLLPDEAMGYYREYTVETAPRVRGPWRIVTGDGGEYYWTADHYDSFARIVR
ncbi:ribonuclease T1 [Nocardioides cavernae]|uniref:Ribonuclease T1 n=1 Tax=Nocardioides cavernae TaxID=1921566 RepID=A0A7Y9H5X2_9ACTN|nr:ribonuclease domain-containing protein [Nocardioides cavernae]NYE38509.1 ribonuclease T1 [Nocardioides cavernae]